MLVDIVAKGGNLLLNVGPRGADAQIPEEHASRLDWLGAWMGAHADAVRATRPWVRPGAATTEGAPVRYTARGDIVFALLGSVDGPVTLAEVASTPTTVVEAIDGRSLGWQDSAGGLVLEPPTTPTGFGPTVIVLRDVDARSASSEVSRR